MQQVIATSPKAAEALTAYLQHSDLVGQSVESENRRLALALSEPTPYRVVTLDCSIQQLVEASRFAEFLNEAVKNDVNQYDERLG